MIFDNFLNCSIYKNIHPRLSKAFSYLSSMNQKDMIPGRIDLDGDNLYVLVQEYEPKPVENGLWEAHRKYFDVQYLYSGSERIDVALADTMHLLEYNETKDFQALSGNGNPLILTAGQFVVFFPDDAHKPGLTTGQPGKVKKIVFKCKL